MRVLVTGGAGFIGSHIVSALLDAGHEVTVVDDLSSGKREHVDPRAAFVQLDIASDGLVEALVAARPECVVHQAAQVEAARSVREPAFDARVNIIGTIHLLEACRQAGVRKLVYASSAAVYGDPRELPVDEAHPVRPASPYGASKLAVEHYLEIYRAIHGLEYTALRYANVYGPRQDMAGEAGVVAIFARRVVRGETVTIHGDGGQTRDFIYVGDVARANVLALTRGDGAVVNIGCARETSVNELLEEICRTAGRSVPVRYAPERQGDIRRSVLNNKRAQEILGWSPRVDLLDGLRQLIQYEQTGGLGPSHGMDSTEGRGFAGSNGSS